MVFSVKGGLAFPPRDTFVLFGVFLFTGIGNTLLSILQYSSTARVANRKKDPAITCTVTINVLDSAPLPSHKRTAVMHKNILLLHEYVSSLKYFRKRYNSATTSTPSSTAVSGVAIFRVFIVLISCWVHDISPVVDGRHPNNGAERRGRQWRGRGGDVFHVQRDRHVGRGKLLEQGERTRAGGEREIEQ